MAISESQYRQLLGSSFNNGREVVIEDFSGDGVDCAMTGTYNIAAEPTGQKNARFVTVKAVAQTMRDEPSVGTTTTLKITDAQQAALASGSGRSLQLTHTDGGNSCPATGTWRTSANPTGSSGGYEVQLQTVEKTMRADPSGLTLAITDKQRCATPARR